MLTDYSAPEYQLNKDAMHFEPLLASNYQFRCLLIQRVWRQWDIFIRPTVTGMFVIRLHRKYNRMQAIDRMARDVLDLQQSFDLSGAIQQYDKILSDPIICPFIRSRESTKSCVGRCFDGLVAGR